MSKDMVRVRRYGQMELNTKVNGLTTKLMEKENSGMLMVTSMMVIGLMIRQMVMVFTCM